MYLLLLVLLSSLEDRRLYFDLQERFDQRVIVGVEIVIRSISSINEEAIRESIEVYESIRPHTVFIITPSHNKTFSIEELYDLPEGQNSTLLYENLLFSLKKRGIYKPVSRDGQLSLSYPIYMGLLDYLKKGEDSILSGLLHTPSLKEILADEVVLTGLIEELVTNVVAISLSNHLFLRPLLLDQLKGHLHQLEELTQTLHLNSIYPLSTQLKRVYRIKIKKIEEDPSSILYYTYWLIIHREKRVAIGSIGPKGYPDSKSILEIGYGLEEEWWGYGFMREAILAFTTFALENLSIKGVKATTYKTNLASQRVLVKTGFVIDNQDEEYIDWLKRG